MFRSEEYKRGYDAGFKAALLQAVRPAQEARRATRRLLGPDRLHPDDTPRL